MDSLKTPSKKLEPPSSIWTSSEPQRLSLLGQQQISGTQTSASPSLRVRRLRQGEWHRVVSASRLPEQLDGYLKSEIRQSDFQPGSLPSQEEVHEVVETNESQDQRPEEWEKIGLESALMFKMLFTATGFWGLGDHIGSQRERKDGP